MPHINVLESQLAALVVIDVQEKLLPVITTTSADELLGKISTLVRACALMDVPIIYTEQYPKGLGRTHPALADLLHNHIGPIQKQTCSCWREEEFRNALQRTEREHVIIAGVESHVCVQQTALDLMRVDYVPFLASDAIGSRNMPDTQIAIERMRRAGVEISTTESLIFELVERCDHPRFKEIVQLIK